MRTLAAYVALRMVKQAVEGADPELPACLARIEVAGPGFLNLYLRDSPGSAEFITIEAAEATGVAELKADPAVGQLVQDASYMVTVPRVAPDVPALQKDPVVAAMVDSFSRPCPIRSPS